VTKLPPMMKASIVAAAVLVAACKGDAKTPPEAAPAPSAQESAAPAEPMTRSKWWALANKSHVYTAARRIDADNGLRLLQSPAREIAVRALDDMAAQSADAAGLRAASQLARDAQDKTPEARRAIANAGMIVLGGLVASACAEHQDLASQKKLVVAIRVMPLPHLEMGHGGAERSALEQEMRAVLDDKTMKAALAGAPGPKRSD
jgi:hypothetical protein